MIALNRRFLFSDDCAAVNGYSLPPAVDVEVHAQNPTSRPSCHFVAPRVAGYSIPRHFQRLDRYVCSRLEKQFHPLADKMPVIMVGASADKVSINYTRFIHEYPATDL